MLTDFIYISRPYEIRKCRVSDFIDNREIQSKPKATPKRVFSFVKLINQTISRRFKNVDTFSNQEQMVSLNSGVQQTT